MDPSSGDKEERGENSCTEHPPKGAIVPADNADTVLCCCCCRRRCCCRRYPICCVLALLLMLSLLGHPVDARTGHVKVGATYTHTWPHQHTHTDLVEFISPARCDLEKFGEGVLSGLDSIDRHKKIINAVREISRRRKKDRTKVPKQELETVSLIKISLAPLVSLYGSRHNNTL